MNGPGSGDRLECVPRGAVPAIGASPSGSYSHQVVHRTPLTLRWDRTQAAIAASVPLVVLGRLLPAQAKGVVGALLAVAAFGAASVSPPAGLFLALVGIYHGPLLLSADPTAGGNWGKIIAACAWLGVMVCRWSRKEPVVALAERSWLLFAFAAAAFVPAIYFGEFSWSFVHQNLIVNLLLLQLVYNCARSVCEAETSMVTLLAVAQSTFGLAMIGRENFTYRLQGSLAGNLSDPNTLALALTFTLPFAWHFYATASNKLGQLWGLVSLAAGLYMIAWTASRGAIFGLAVGAIVLLRASGQRLRQLTTVLVLVTAAVLALPEDIRDYTWRHLASQTPGSQLSAHERVLLLQDSIRAFLARPWLGYGVGTSQFVVASSYTSFYGSEKNVHNCYAQIAVELGIAGLLPFLAFLVSVARGLVGTSRKRHGSMFPLARSVLAGLLAFAVGSCFLGNYLGRDWYVVLGLAAAVAATNRQ